jgi:hypothetical protein
MSENRNRRIDQFFLFYSARADGWRNLAGTARAWSAGLVDAKIRPNSCLSRGRRNSCHALCALVFSALIVPPAYAIECSGDFQVQKNGNLIVTPYCQDDHLATVSREYGIATSADRIRSSLTEKKSVCQFLQFDNRVRDACIQGGGTNFSTSH